MLNRFIILSAFFWFSSYELAWAQSASAVEDIRERLDQFEVQPADSLFRYENEQYSQAVAARDKHKQVLALRSMGQICFHMGLFSQSLHDHLKADALLEEMNEKITQADNLNDLGMLFLLNNQPQEAKRVYFNALAMYKRHGHQIGIANTLGNIGHLYEKMIDLDSAFFYQQKAMVVFEKLKDLDGMALIYENLGSIYEDKEQFDQAFPFFSKALERFKVNGNTAMLIDAYNNMGDIYRKTGRYQEALEYTKTAEHLSKKHKAYSRLSSAYRDLGKTYTFLNKADSAFRYLELSRQLYIEIYNEDSKNQAALLKVVYEIQQKDARIAAMVKQRRTAAMVYLASGVVAFLLIVLAFVVIKNQRLRIKSERKLRDNEAALLGAKQGLMEAELKNKKLQEEQLKKEVEHKAREITTHTLQAIEKNQLLDEMKMALTEIIKNDSRSYKKELRQLLNKINQSSHKEAAWGDFRRVFEEINQDFFYELQKIGPDLSATDLRLVSLIKLNMNSPDIATLLGISADSLRVSRYRLRKKLGLEAGKSLTAFLQAI